MPCAFAGRATGYRMSRQRSSVEDDRTHRPQTASLHPTEQRIPLFKECSIWLQRLAGRNPQHRAVEPLKPMFQHRAVFGCSSLRQADLALAAGCVMPEVWIRVTADLHRALQQIAHRAQMTVRDLMA